MVNHAEAGREAVLSKVSWIYGLIISVYVEFHGKFKFSIKNKPNMVKKSIYIGFSDFFFKLSQKIDLNMSEYVEFYGDHVFLVQMSPNIAQISIFINFMKNRIFRKKS